MSCVSSPELVLTDWLNVCEFEALFWLESEHIKKYDRALVNERPSFVQQHPSSSHTGPGAKHVDEWLPLLLFAKHVSGDILHWDSTMQVRVSRTGRGDPKTPNGCSFDAIYRFISNQPGISEDRQGYIEVTRAMNSQQGANLVRRDRTLSRLGLLTEAAFRFDEGVLEVQREILRAVRRKAAKHYEPNTSLLIWLRDEPPALTFRLHDTEFAEELIREAKGVFKHIACVGTRTGVKWMLGEHF